MATRELDRIFDKTEPAQGENVDRELALSFQRGDRWAYDSIYRRYASRVQSVCRRMLSDPQDAQDAAQETFLRVYQSLPKFNGQYQLGAWINRIATNVCLDYLRSRSRSPSDAAPNEVLDDWAGEQQDASPEDALMRHVEGMRVHETLASLSPLHRRAITMRDLEGRDYRDIASTLGVPEARARVLLHRARKGFKRSWVSAWIFLGFPTRLLQRVRRFRDPGVGDSLMEAAGSAAHAVGPSAPLAASCSQVAQSCSAVVSERIAAAAAAALVGVGVSAAGGASAGFADRADLVRPPAMVAREQASATLAGAVKIVDGAATRVEVAAGGVVEVADGVTDVVTDAAAAVGVPVEPEAEEGTSSSASGDPNADSDSTSDDVEAEGSTSSEEPAADASTSEDPAADASTSEEPEADASTSEEPAADASTSEDPAADASTSEEPSSDSESVGDSSSDAASTEPEVPTDSPTAPPDEAVAAPGQEASATPTPEPSPTAEGSGSTGGAASPGDPGASPDPGSQPTPGEGESSAGLPSSNPSPTPSPTPTPTPSAAATPAAMEVVEPS